MEDAEDSDFVAAETDELFCAAGISTDFDTAVSALQAEKTLLGVVTRSEKGCVVVTQRDLVCAAAYPVAEVVDTTGAGDLFAAGFLAGYTKGLSHERSAALGALAAGEIISHVGARPQKNLLQFARDNQLLA